MILLEHSYIKLLVTTMFTFENNEDVEMTSEKFTIFMVFFGMKP